MPGAGGAGGVGARSGRCSKREVAVLQTCAFREAENVYPYVQFMIFIFCLWGAVVVEVESKLPRRRHQWLAPAFCKKL